MAFTVVSFVSFTVLLSFFIYSSVLVNLVKARTTPTGVHIQEPLNDGVLSQTHFADFLRALYAPQMPKEIEKSLEMPNELFPFIEDHHTEGTDSDNEGIGGGINEFPGTGVMIPVLQKRNAR